LALRALRTGDLTRLLVAGGARRCCRDSWAQLRPEPIAIQTAIWAPLHRCWVTGRLVTGDWAAGRQACAGTRQPVD
jgi:hypothetical protein